MNEIPLFPTKEAAYAADGEIYQHYKGGETGMGPRRKAGGAWRRGGVAEFFSRKISVTRLSLEQNSKYATEAETGEIGVVYEHLWPHNHSFFFRQQELFFGKNMRGEVRFKLVKKAE